MKNLSIFFLLVCLGSIYASDTHSTDLYDNFLQGDAEIESISGLTFGPDGILFIGDSQNAKIVALRTGDNVKRTEVSPVSLSQLDIRLGAVLGVSPEQLTISDMAVNPISGKIYFGVELESGKNVLLVLENDEFMALDLSDVYFSSMELHNAVDSETKDRRGRSMRKWAISDLRYYNGQVLVSGLSNEEFSSTLRSIPFPFSGEQDYASIEIYHAAHGQYETYAPVKTFMPYRLNGVDHVIASFTCTPLVVFPMNEIKSGVHSKGRTVAELGNRNTPLDIVEYQKEGKSYILLANSSRALMKIDLQKIAAYEGGLTEPVEESSATAGVNFLALPYTNVLQMDKLSGEHIVLLLRKSNGDLDLDTVSSSRL